MNDAMEREVQYCLDDIKWLIKNLYYKGQSESFKTEFKKIESSNPRTYLALKDVIGEMENLGKQGDPVASYYVGLRYMYLYENTGVRGEGIPWLERASEAGISDASYVLALIFLMGSTLRTGKRKNISKAVSFVQLSVEQDPDNAMALNILGMLYSKGICIEQSYEKAFECYKKASEMGYAAATYNLHVYYLNGIVVEKDKYKAFRLLLEAVEDGDMDAAMSLARLLKTNQVLVSFI